MPASPTGTSSWPTPTRRRAPAGMSGFIVPRSTPGITVGKKEQNMGQRASDTRGITFEEVVVPKKNMLGEEGRAGRSRWRPSITPARWWPRQRSGWRAAAMEHAIAYAKERQAFGSPIAAHEAVSFMIADMAKDVEAARQLVRLAAWTIDQGSAQHALRRLRQGLRGRHGDAGRHRRRAGVRGQRLQQGVSGREAVCATPRSSRSTRARRRSSG